jgi:hypothetical protein
MNTRETIEKVMVHRHNLTDLSIGKGQFVGVRNNREGLAKLFAELGFTEGVEVGTQRAHYSYRLCIDNPKLHLTCVDPWNSFGGKGQRQQNTNYETTVERMKPFNCTILRMTSMEGVSQFKDKSIDFVYIDGNHTFDYVASDIIFWSRKVKSGGIVACHDYCQWWEVGVPQAVDAYTFCHGIMPIYVTAEESPTAFWVNP